MQVSFSADEVAAIVQPQASRGATRSTVRGIAALRDAAAGDLSFLGNQKYKADVAGTRASVVLLPADYVGEPQPDQQYLLVANPSVALARICARIEQTLWPKPPAGIHPSAVVDASATIADTATIGPNCVVEAGANVGDRSHLQANVFLGRNATVGADCWLMPGVVVGAENVIGNRVRLQPGAVIGSDGFGYEFVNGRHEKVPQVGNVVLGDDVEIGANTTIDRARFSRTLIGEGTKVDNLVQIAHNVVIGRHCVIVAQVGISGSTTLEDYVIVGGQAGIAGHLRLAKGTKVGGQSGVNGDTDPGSFVNGTPAVAYNLERRLVVLYRRLPEIFRRVDELERHVRDAK